MTQVRDGQERPLILVVAMAGSVHAARWLASVRDAPFRFVLIPVVRDVPTRDFGHVVPVDSADAAEALPPGAIGVWTRDVWGETAPLPAPLLYADRANLVGSVGIADAVEQLRPALVHSMEVQHAGYACFGAAQRMEKRFPRWLVSNWGSDFQLYRKLPAHQSVLEAIARRMDAYIGECERDIRIVRELGYTGPVLPTIPASCGMSFAALPRLQDVEPPSKRRNIVVKGYHGWSGRALHILSAIHLAAPRLARFRIRVTLGSPPVAAMVEYLRARDGLDIVMEPYVAFEDALQRLATARMTVGMGISDGIGTTTLESMALGSFPIAGTSSCACEWLRTGRDGFVIEPHDVLGFARALEIAATDDRLVDEAATRNRAHVERHWDAVRNGDRIAAMYASLVAHTPEIGQPVSSDMCSGARLSGTSGSQPPGPSASSGA